MTNNFSKQTIKSLKSKGIQIIGMQAIPDSESSMPYANADNGYIVDDNGTCKIWRFVQVLEAAK